MRVLQGFAGGALGLIGGLVVAFMIVGVAGNSGASKAQAMQTEQAPVIRVAIPGTPAAR